MRALLARLREAALHRFGARPLIGLGAAAFLAVISWLFQDFITTKVLPYVWGGAKMLFALPVGLFGFILFAVLASLVIVAFAETSPILAGLRERLVKGRSQAPVKPEAPRPAPPPTELRAIDDVRVFWRQSAKPAADELKVLFLEMSELGARDVFFPLVMYPLGQLDTARNNLSSALADASSASFNEVRNYLDALLDSYMLLVRWAHACERVRPTIFKKPPHEERYGRWHARHEELVNELGKLTKRANLGSLIWALENLVVGKERMPENPADESAAVEWAVKVVDRDLFLAITNRGTDTVCSTRVESQTGGDGEAAVPWVVPWYADGRETRILQRNEPELLHLVRLEPVGEPQVPATGWRPGRFRFFTLSAERELYLALYKTEDLYLNRLRVVVSIRGGDGRVNEARTVALGINRDNSPFVAIEGFPDTVVTRS
jgi:hypothetical protein